MVAGNTPEDRAAGRMLLVDEQTFIDLAKSELVYAQKFEVIANTLA